MNFYLSFLMLILIRAFGYSYLRYNLYHGTVVPTVRALPTVGTVHNRTPCAVAFRCLRTLGRHAMRVNLSVYDCISAKVSAHVLFQKLRFVEWVFWYSQNPAFVKIVTQRAHRPGHMQACGKS
jgi:hypothetical protein